MSNIAPRPPAGQPPASPPLARPAQSPQSTVLPNTPPTGGGGSMDNGGAPAGGMDASGGEAVETDALAAIFPGLDASEPITRYLLENINDCDETDLSNLAAMSPGLAGTLSKILPELAPVWQVFGAQGGEPTLQEIQSIAEPGGAPAAPAGRSPDRPGLSAI